MTYYKYIDKYNLEKYPGYYYEVKYIDDEPIEFKTTTMRKELVEGQGYYPAQYTSPPDDEYEYTPYWDEGSIGRPYHLQMWERGELKPVIEEQPSELQQAFAILRTNTQDATTIKGLREGIDAAVSQIANELGGAANNV